MKELRELYRKDPRRWIPTVFILFFLPLLTVYTVIDGFMQIWPGWVVIGLMTIGYTWNVIYEIRKRKKQNSRWPEL